jgi:hypothetical protein
MKDTIEEEVIGETTEEAVVKDTAAAIEEVVVIEEAEVAIEEVLVIEEVVEGEDEAKSLMREFNSLRENLIKNKYKNPLRWRGKEGLKCYSLKEQNIERLKRAG